MGHGFVQFFSKNSSREWRYLISADATGDPTPSFPPWPAPTDSVGVTGTP